jgi:serine/threonine protein phosphatase PrpC
MTRSFGDRIGHTIGMISTPEITEVSLQESDLGVVLGSDGLWDRLSPADIARLLKNGGHQVDAAKSCQMVIDAAEHCRGTKSQHLAGAPGIYMDDITCIIGLFNRRLLRTARH